MRRADVSSAREREDAWKRARLAGNGHVFCNLCHCEIVTGDDWDLSHAPIPKTLGGSSTAPGHRRCNIKDNVEYVTPTAARVRRKHRWHMGITGPGLSANALPGGRRDNISKKLNGEVVPRLPRYGKHAQTMAALWPHGRLE
jgi:hypothetical protein